MAVHTAYLHSGSFITSQNQLILMVQQFWKNRETKQKWHFQRDFQKSNWTRHIIQLKSHVCGVVCHQLKLRIVSWWYHVCGIVEWNSCLKFLQNCFVTFSGLISLYFMCQTWKHCWRISILCKTAEFPSCHNKIEDYSWQATLFPPRMICIIVWIKFDNWKEWMVKSSLAKIKLF